MNTMLARNSIYRIMVRNFASKGFRSEGAVSTTEGEEIFTQVARVDFHKNKRYKIMGYVTIPKGERMGIWKKNGTYETLVGPKRKFLLQSSYQIQVCLL